MQKAINKTASGLKHDDQGFLIGEYIEALRYNMRAQDENLTEIAENTRALLEFFLSNAKGMTPDSITTNHSHAVSSPDMSNQTLKNEGAVSSVENNSQTTNSTTNNNDLSTTKNNVQNNVTNQPVQTPNNRAVQQKERKRNALGQFVSETPDHDKNQKTALPNEAGTNNNGSIDAIKNRQASRDIVSSITNALQGFTSSNSQLDPTIAALDEVMTPFNRVIRGVSWAKQKKEQIKQSSLLQRILKAVGLSRDSQEKSDKQTQKTLKDILKKPYPSQGNGILSSILSALAVPLLALLAGIFAAIKAIGKGAIGKIGKIAGFGNGRDNKGFGNGSVDIPNGGKTDTTKPTEKSGKAAGFLKKLPFVGALIAGAYAINEISDTNADENKTQAEKDEQNGKVVGGVTGALAGGIGGAVVGAAVGSIVPVIGTAIGGIIGGIGGAIIGDIAGQSVGVKLGEAVNDLRNGFTSFIDYAKTSWDGFTSFAKDAFDSVSTAAKNVFTGLKSAFSALYDGVSDTADKVNNYIEDKSGVNVKQNVNNFFGGAKSVAENSAKTIQNTAVNLASKAKEGAEKTVTAISQKASNTVKEAQSTAEAATNYVANNTVAGQAISKTVEKAKEVTNNAIISTGRSLGNLAPSYRHKESFDGIRGGESLARYGSYTNEEANLIRELKTNGSNTGVGRYMPDDVRDKIVSQAQASGLNPETMLRMAMMESGGNANAISKTGAVGLYQFTGRTATGTGIENRFDVDQNIAGAMKLTNQSKAVLEKNGIEATTENLYMMHQLGVSGGLDVIKGSMTGASVSELKPSTQTAMGFNVGSGSSSASEYMARNANVLAHVNMPTLNTQTNSTTLANNQGGNSIDTAPSQTNIGNTTALTNNNAIEKSIEPPISVKMPTSSMVASSSVSVPAASPIMPSKNISIPSVESVSDINSFSQSQSSDRVVQVSSNVDPNMGRDLSDRRIAHIVTGGMAGGA